MTLICGVNLSDRVYLAADCRASHFKDPSSDKPSKILDRINKTKQLNNEICIAAAGDVQYSKYMFNALLTSSIINNGISYLREHIERWFHEHADQYLRNNPYAKMCFIIGGIDLDKNKQINGKGLIEKIKNFQELRQVQMQMKDAIFKGLSAKPNGPNPMPTLPVKNTYVFGVMSDPKNFFFKIEDTQWGDILAYGPKGFTKEKIPETLFGQLEFESGAGNYFRDNSLLTAFIKSTSENFGLPSIGGSVVVMGISEYLNGVALISGKIHRIKLGSSQQEIVSDIEVREGRLFGRTDAGVYVPLVDFPDYPYKSGMYLL